jgi:hypothetical protein
MNDETQAPQNGTEGDPAPTEAQGTTTLDLTAADAAQGAGLPVNEVAAEAVNEAVSLTHTESGVVTNLSPTATAVPAGVHGVVSKLESELHGEFAKGQTSFLTWMGSIIAEFKAHLKM